MHVNALNILCIQQMFILELLNMFSKVFSDKRDSYLVYENANNSLRQNNSNNVINNKGIGISI